MNLSTSVQDERINEKIGLLGSSSTLTLLQSAFIESPCSFFSKETIESLVEWAKVQKPRLLILEAKILGDDGTDSKPESLRETIDELGIPALFLTRSAEEGRKWNQNLIPSGHFFHGPVNAHHLKRKIYDVLDQASFPARPVVAVFSEHTFLLSHLELLLKNYGVRMIAFSSFKPAPDSECLALAKADCCLWDVNSGVWSKEAVMRFLRQVRGDHLPQIIRVAENGSKIVAGNGQNHLEPIYSLNNLSHLASEIASVLQKTKSVELKLCRDSYTGFYLPQIFVEFGEREIALSGRTGEPFSILRISLGNMDSVESHFGSIFVKELEMNLGLFVQSRVRASDLVAKGKKGEILLLLCRISRELALLVGERLRHSFVKAASFQEAAAQKFDPRLDYDIYTYPHEIRSVEDIKKFIFGDIAPVNSEGQKEVKKA